MVAVERPKTHNYPLGFAIVGNNVIHNSGGVQPATMVEKKLWAECNRLQGELTVAAIREESRSDTSLRN